ncbi:hypothetical protein B0S90_1187 [Caldicellulosiruptor bescii]|uniref:Uncharacterized protein n=2 Tax=Caldicellulosiruptor bescii TaxID=31899 RepID=B9MQP3_CALBD|nr:hypothetical protein [Caldicellulosiruptor bescii]ACM59997.1 conserved hypothetical protein [Caldicellulosiruptor bescii DSM 6725]PBC87416.1 hypothetical protein B0S87_0315 [Caldicellulosiruptor bescii]PBC90356.1 hypothetical protein B0S89_0689 [Caldicellulosiruptor bescii]PBD04218.1 hypothetical protein B0S85_1861 [Caldicellulosiruptor bescii]PBD06153.1 hypothetical protein B0S90_1187 [Caldicellulosiruptor bescii]
MYTCEFGIIYKIDQGKKYYEYEPERYDCVYINCDIVLDWWEVGLNQVKTYIGVGFEKEFYGIDVDGVSLIPPESLSVFEKIVESDPRTKEDPSLKELLKKIKKAKEENKYMICFGV